MPAVTPLCPVSYTSSAVTQLYPVKHTSCDPLVSSFKQVIICNPLVPSRSYQLCSTCNQCNMPAMTHVFQQNLPSAAYLCPGKHISFGPLVFSEMYQPLPTNVLGHTKAHRGTPVKKTFEDHCSIYKTVLQAIFFAFKQVSSSSSSSIL